MSQLTWAPCGRRPRLASIRSRAIGILVIRASATPVRAFDEALTVAALAARYHDHIQSRSARYRERQAGLLDKWVLPALGDRLRLSGPLPPPSACSPTPVGTSRRPRSRASVRTCVRSSPSPTRADGRPATSTRCGSFPTPARPSTKAKPAGSSPARRSPPTTSAQLFKALQDLGEPTWALAMRLKHRCGARWGELIALRPRDIVFEPHRVIRIERAVEQTSTGRSIKATRNEHKRWSLFPTSLAEDLHGRVRAVADAQGP